MTTKLQTLFSAGHITDLVHSAMARQANGEQIVLYIRMDDDGVSISSDNPKVDNSNKPTASVSYSDGNTIDTLVPSPAPLLRPWKFEMHSEVVLETSRAALEDEKRFEREEAARKRARAGAGRTEPSTVIGQTLATLEARTIGVPIERGIVVGRLEYDSGSRQYLVRYKSGAGSQVEAWWDGDALFQDEGDEQVADEEKHR